MNIRSIDLQVLIPRATEVSKIQDVSDRQPGLQQQLSAEQLNQNAAQRQVQVQSAAKGEGGKVEKEQQRERRGRDKRKKGTRVPQDLQDDGQEGDEDPFLGHHIDIKT